MGIMFQDEIDPSGRFDGTDRPYQNVISCIDAVLEVQRSRAEAYGRFEQAFRRYLEIPGSANEANYRSVMDRLTQEFNELSQQVIGLQRKFEELQRPEEVDLLLNLQHSERKKLEITIGLQALRSYPISHHIPHQSTNADRGLVHGACGDCLSHFYDSTSIEESSAVQARDVEAAIAESYRDLEVCITDINSILEELRQKKIDLLVE